MVPPRRVLVLWDKIYRRKIVILLISRKNDISTFLKPRRVPLRLFLVLWDKNILTENRDIPLRSLKVLDTRKYWNTKQFPHKKFRYRETKTTSTNSGYSYYLETCWYQNASKTHKGSSAMHLALRDNKFWTENCDISIISLNTCDTRF